MKMRRATLDDLENLFEMDARCFEPWIAYDRETFYTLLLRRGTYAPLIEIHGQLAAFAIVTRGLDNIGHLVTIDVDEQHRRKGLAQQLLDAVIADLVNKASVELRLEVSVTNEPAKAFYERNGFEVYSTEVDYYGPGSQALFMRKSLEPGNKLL